jgi:predicted DNA-binding protein with PD1-like motif
MRSKALFRLIGILPLLTLPVTAGESFAGAQIQEVIRLRLDRGDLLLESIQAAIGKHKIEDGAVLTAAGSLQVCTYHGVKTLAEKPEQQFTTVQGPLEIIGVNGLIAAGEPHIHMTLSRPEGGAIGGHLEKGCKVLYRAELTIAKFSGTALARKPNQAGVPMLQKR